MISCHFVVVARGGAGGGVRQRDAPEHFIEAAFFRVQFFKLPIGLRNRISHGAREVAIARLLARINARPDDGGQM